MIHGIVMAVGSEDSVKGAAHFEADVLTHKPDVLFLNHALNDRRIGLDRYPGGVG